MFGGGAKICVKNGLGAWHPGVGDALPILLAKTGALQRLFLERETRNAA
jgi:hypothetical protein